PAQRWGPISGCCSTRANCWSRSRASRSAPARWPTNGTRCGRNGSADSPASSTANTAANQWLERTLDDSANRRLTLPEAFLATDAILVLATNIAAGIEVRPDTIRRHVDEQMPFMATERLLMLGVEAGGDRQALHEVIRTNSLAAAERVSKGGPNDLLERLAGDHTFAKVP